MTPEPETAEPTPGRERLIQVACGVGLLLQSVRYYVTLPFLVYLAQHPLVYEVVHPSTLALVIGGAQARTGASPAWAVVVLGLVGLALVDPLRWLAGHRYGDRVALLLAGNRVALVRRVERYMDRWGTVALVVCWFTPIPVIFVQLAAGTSGMSLKRFLAADLAGTLLWVLAIAGVGYAFGQSVVDTVKHVAHYSLYVTFGLIAIALVVGVVKGMRAAQAAPPADL